MVIIVYVIENEILIVSISHFGIHVDKQYIMWGSLCLG